MLVHQLEYFEEDGRPYKGRWLWRDRPFPFVLNYGPFARFVMLENDTMAKLKEEETRLRARKPARVFMQQLAEEPALFPQAATLARVAACLSAEQQKLRESMADEVEPLDATKKAQFLSTHARLEVQNNQVQKHAEKFFAEKQKLVALLNAQCCPFSDICGLTGAVAVLME